MSSNALWEMIKDHYLNSNDFNGYPIRLSPLPLAELKSSLTELINENAISLSFGDLHPNPYVKCLHPHPTDTQVQLLKEASDITHIVAYPEGDRLRKAINHRRFSGKPYRLAVAKGSPTLDCAFFKLDVLERFRNDPRYSFRANDVIGTIYSKTENMGKEEVFIKSVGFAYDDDMNRAVCLFYVDLMNMSKEQQQLWRHYEVEGTYRPHPDFVWSQIYGQWPEKATLSEAITAELKVINDISLDCYGKKLFKRDYLGADRPHELAFLIRPTAKELNSFIHTLDKIFSDNLNTKFFKGFIEPEIEKIRPDGKIEVNRKSSLTMLKEFILNSFTPKLSDQRNEIDEMFETFKYIRSLRTKPAHSIEEDIFDMKYFKEQRELYIDAYKAIRLLRLILQNHPKADRSKIPKWLYEGKIGTY